MGRYIDADELYKVIAKEANFQLHHLKDAEARGLISAMKTIKHFPTADVVKVGHGRWIPCDPESDVRFVCSECDTEISTSWDYEADEMWSYCPRCGARMDGERKSQDDKTP